MLQISTTLLQNYYRITMAVLQVTTSHYRFHRKESPMFANKPFNLLFFFILKP